MVTIRGIEGFADELEDFADSLDEIADELDQAIDKGVKQTALQIESTAKRKAPVFDHPFQGQGGELRADIGSVPLEWAEYSVGTTKEYAPPTEYGSAPHTITPNGPYPLRFTNRGGEEIRTYSVDHPGTPAQPFLRPALNRHRTDLVDNIRDEIEKVIDRHT
jgi:HK97 gp10 family phage protein